MLTAQDFSRGKSNSGKIEPKEEIVLRLKVIDITTLKSYFFS